MISKITHNSHTTIYTYTRNKHLFSNNNNVTHAKIISETFCIYWKHAAEYTAQRKNRCADFRPIYISQSRRDAISAYIIQSRVCTLMRVYVSRVSFASGPEVLRPWNRSIHIASVQRIIFANVLIESIINSGPGERASCESLWHADCKPIVEYRLRCVRLLYEHISDGQSFFRLRCALFVFILWCVNDDSFESIERVCVLFKWWISQLLTAI